MLSSIIQIHAAWLSFIHLISAMAPDVRLTHFHKLSERKLLSGGVYNYQILTDLMGVNGLNTLRPRQNGRLFADDTFKRILLNENVRISSTISLKFVPKGPINNNPALVQIMAWRRPGDKPLSEPMMVSLPMHICVARPLWVKEKITAREWSPKDIVFFWVTRNTLYCFDSDFTIICFYVFN